MSQSRLQSIKQEQPYQIQQLSATKSLVQLSNTQYLLNYINILDFNPDLIFKKIIMSATQYIQKDALTYPFGISINYEPVSFQKFTKQFKQKRQKGLKQQIKKQIDNSLKQKYKILTKQQLKEIIKRKKEEQILENQDQKKRILQAQEQKYFLKEKIKQTIKIQKGKKMKDVATNLSVEDLAVRLDQLNKNRYELKNIYYKVQKDQTYEQQCVLQNWISNHNEMKSLLQLYMEIIAQGKPFNQIYKQIHPTDYSQLKKISKFQKYFNSLYLDQRQLQLIQMRIENTQTDQKLDTQRLNKKNNQLNKLSNSQVTSRRKYQ